MHGHYAHYDPVGAVAHEYANLSLTRRVMLRFVSPGLATAARNLTYQPRAYTNVPLLRPGRKPGPTERRWG